MASAKGHGTRWSKGERSRKKKKVVELAAEGLKQREIAARIGISDGMVNKLLAESRPPEKKKPIRISGIREVDVGLPRGKVHRFIVTSAQDDTPVHQPFLDNLFAYAAHMGADFMVGGYTYQLGLFEDHAAATAVYAEPLRDYLCTDRYRLTDDLLLIGDANVLPTTANPLAGWTTANRGHHVIVPHARVALESIPRPQDSPPRYSLSTGTCTMPNYTPRAAGRKAIFHHTFGALLVEIDTDGECFFHQLIADDSGSFQHLDARVEDGIVTMGHAVKAVTFGDLHHRQLDDTIALASFGCSADGSREADGSLLDTLQPEFVFVHDTHDHRTRNHHDLYDPHSRAKVLREGGSVEDEVKAAARFVNAIRRQGCRTVIVESNHDAALAKWLKNADGALDPENAWYWHALNASWHKAIRAGNDNFNVVEKAFRHGGLARDVEFVPSGGSFIVCGVECGLHGDLGVSGSKGSPNQFRRIGPKVTSGHTHAPQIVEGVYVAGVSARLQQGYNKGLTKWAHAHVVLYANGKRGMILMAADGRYRATGDRAVALAA